LFYKRQQDRSGQGCTGPPSSGCEKTCPSLASARIHGVRPLVALCSKTIISLVNVGRVGFFFQTQGFVLGTEFVGLKGIGVRTKPIKQFKYVCTIGDSNSI
jgi:hypothetical protein